MSNSNFGSYGDTGVENLAPKRLKVLTKKKGETKRKIGRFGFVDGGYAATTQSVKK
jgi:hypothetical protein